MSGLITEQLLLPDDELYKRYQSAATCGCFLWSLFMEVQIALAFATSCHKLVTWTKALRLTVPLSFFYATSFSVFLGFGYSHEESIRDTVWVAHVACCILLAVVFYLWALVGTLAAPSFARRQALLRGASFAAGTFMVFIPNVVLDTITVLRGVDVDRADILDSGNSWACIGTVCQLLYCLNGVINVGTYAFWVPKKTYSDQREWTLSELEDIAIDNYFDLTSTDIHSFISRTSAAEAIAVAREVRSWSEPSSQASHVGSGPTGP